MNETLAALFRIDTAGITQSPDSGLMAQRDHFPGITNVGEPDVSEFIGPDPDAPAIIPDADNVPALLRQIRDNTARPEHQPVYVTRVIPIPTAAGEQSVRIQTSFRHVAVLRAPREMEVYAGEGRTLYLATLAAGESLRASMPFPVNGVTLAWASDATESFVTVVMSSEKMEVEIT